MNTALILEEFRRDLGAPAYIVFLDAKAAFDIISHQSLKRKLFNIGVEGHLWTLVNILHQDAQSAVKWQGEISGKFKVDQGVRQGGILHVSMDLYKVYSNNLLDRLTLAKDATKIGPMICCSSLCCHG